VPTLVVAALSARWLALSARRAGWNVVALDLFGDVDTRAASSAWHAIGDAATLRIDGERFLAALASAGAGADGWIVGAGFEARPDLLEAGARFLPLLGNNRATIARVREPGVFFAALAELGIPHPETTLAAPPDPRHWLVKNFNASGGWHIRRAEAARAHAAEPGAYFQREMKGRPMSMLFAAAGDRAVPIGINELLVRAHGARPYVYHGAIGPVMNPTAPPGKALSAAVDALVRHFGLRGLGSLDFLLDDDTFNVLEINARPSATLALYDADAPTGLVQVHVDACRGVLPLAMTLDPARARGEQTVYATHQVAISAVDVDRLLALGCHDVPQPASHIAAGAPLCSVCAQGRDPRAVREELDQREAAVLAMVQNRNEAQSHAS
jgi:predicted ATP-grasp superfamily ATP-dependent carboligase